MSISQFVASYAFLYVCIQWLINNAYMNTFRKIGCLLLIAAFSFPCFAKKRIHLKGKWSDRFRTIISEQSIQAWVEDNNKDLLLEFSANLGTVEVTITNCRGTAFGGHFFGRRDERWRCGVGDRWWECDLWIFIINYKIIKNESL